MSEPARCARCGGELLRSAFRGAGCPRCLIEQALGRPPTQNIPRSIAINTSALAGRFHGSPVVSRAVSYCSGDW